MDSNVCVWNGKSGLKTGQLTTITFTSLNQKCSYLIPKTVIKKSQRGQSELVLYSVRSHTNK